MYEIKLTRILFTIIFFVTATAQAQNWEVIEDPKELAALFSDTVIEATLKGGAKAIARYNRDGTGVLKAWGDTFNRTWEVQGNDQVCIQIDAKPRCSRLEKNLDVSGEYRSHNLVTSEVLVLSIRSDGTPTSDNSAITNAGSTANPSAEEIAAKLANPNTPMASLNFKLQHRTYEGALPGANDQSNSTLIFQPSFPFPLKNGDSILFRPALPVKFDQPVFNGGTQSFDSVSGLGDITFDLAYAKTSDTGLLTAFGIISTIPTATKDELGPDLLTLGPELLIGKLTPEWVIGAFPNHQWDVGGSGKGDISITSIQLFGTVLPGGGWSYGTSPTMTYDHNASQWTIPLNFNFGKTVIRNGRPWKLSAEINYYVDQPDSFGPKRMIGFNIAPVVKNPMAGWFK